MTSASEGASAPAPAEKAAENCGGVAAINMPRSSAAVLTSVSTPGSAESCVCSGSGRKSEVSSDVRDTGGRFGCDSDAIKARVLDGIQGPYGPQPIGYHAPALFGIRF